MDVYSKIKSALREMQTTDGGSPIIGEVTGVDGTVCKVKIGELEISDVRLRAVVNSETDLLLITPKIGSRVLMHDLSGGRMRELVIVKFSEVEKINIRTGETTIDVENGKIEINGGDNGGMCNTPELKTQLDKLTARVDGIIDALTNGTTGTQDGGAAYKASVVAALQALTDKENFNDIEDSKITH